MHLKKTTAPCAGDHCDRQMLPVESVTVIKLAKWHVASESACWKGLAENEDLGVQRLLCLGFRYPMHNLTNLVDKSS